MLHIIFINMHCFIIVMSVMLFNFLYFQVCYWLSSRLYSTYVFNYHMSSIILCLLTLYFSTVIIAASTSNKIPLSLNRIFLYVSSRLLVYLTWQYTCAVDECFQAHFCSFVSDPVPRN